MNTPNLKALLAKKDLKPADLARLLVVDKSLVTRWGQNGVPPKRAIAIEAAIGIPLHELRPDLWLPPEKPERELAR